MLPRSRAGVKGACPDALTRLQPPSPEVQGLAPEQYEVIGQKVSHRLAQRPGGFVVLKYVRPVIKRRDTQALHCAAAPRGVIEGSRADVSYIVGLLVDKFRTTCRCIANTSACSMRVSSSADPG